ncbi:MAG: sulfite exporter TauE/SafE family protein [Clostridia bacterium]|nr:sulfite exporter TauE/SafE family protein [Clostridia bacterium]
MSNETRYALFFVVIFFANIIQAITGFAGTTLAMPFSIILVGGEEARLILNILGIASSIGVVILNRKSIVWKEVLKICLIMGVGMAIGFVIIHFANVPKQILYFILAGVILLFAAIGVYTTFFKKEKERKVQETTEQEQEQEDQGNLNQEQPQVEAKPVDKNAPLKEAGLIALLVAAGVVHGMFVCGGPLLIIYATKKLNGKDQFRATLSMAWIVLNTVNLVRDVASGAFTAENVGHLMIVLAIALSTLLVAIIVGNLIAKKLNQKAFMIVTYVLMVISAVSLILNACGIF